MIAYLHPIAGAAVLLLLGYVASLGFQLRQARRNRSALAARHAQLAPIAYAAVLGSWLAGAASTFWGRDDLVLGDALHFATGCALVVLLTGSALTARALRRGSATARDLHPWFGGTAALVAVAHVVAGLRIMP